MEKNIHELIIKYLSGNASERERKELENWKKDEANAEVFRETESAWHLSVHGRESFSPDTNAAWKKFTATVAAEQSSGARERKLKAWHVMAAAAAVIPFILYIAVFDREVALPQQQAMNYVQQTETEAPVNLILNEISTDDSVVVLYLPDSTKVWLNKNSKFSYPDKFIADERVVNLQGEAFFEVKKDVLHPFIIYTETSVTTVKGTSFNLKAYQGQKVELMVVSGEVEFASLEKPARAPVVLRPREKAMLEDKAEPVKTKVKAPESTVSWKKAPKSQTRFKKFLNRIKHIFKKPVKENKDKK